MALKHKDIEWYVGTGWKKAKSYEDAVIKAADSSFINGKVVKIHVVAYSHAGVKWYDNRFNPRDRKKLDFSDDQDHVIDTLSVKLY